MKDIIIVGASGFGRQMLDLIAVINQVEPTWNILGFLDDNLHALDAFDTGYRVLGKISDWVPSENEQYVLAIAAPKTKEKIVPILKEKGARFATILAPTVKFEKRVVLGEGVVMFGGAAVCCDSIIGNFVFMNGQVGIGHDCVIGDYCTFAPNCCIAGGTKMGKCVNVGALASTYPGVSVGDYATIGMNSAVIRRVKPHTTVMGVPAKQIL